jgi:CheY-like chemotaxis protein
VFDGPAALDAANDYPPDVFVLDIGLPGMTGYELARKLRQQPRFRKTPIVAVTGYGQYDDRQKSRQAADFTSPTRWATLQVLLTQGVAPARSQLRAEHRAAAANDHHQGHAAADGGPPLE